MKIDVIIPIYNALSETKRCIASVLKHSDKKIRLVLVNDCSDKYTTKYLEEVASNHKEVCLLNNETNLGFLDTVNKGLSLDLDSYKADFKIILNSDTIVSESWIDSFLECFNSDEKIALACPVSNNAEDLSIRIPTGYDYVSIANLLREKEVESYPDITTIVGFCLAIKTKVLKEIGLFDRIFAPGYGEESDYHYRIIVNAYRAVMIPNCFVYHESHASFSDKKKELIAKNRPVFDDRWKAIHANEHEFMNEDNPVAKLNSVISNIASKEIDYDVLFLLPTGEMFGGVIVVFELVNRLIALGVRANVVITSKPQDIKMNLLFQPYFIEEKDFLERMPESKVYCATLFSTTPLALLANSKYPDSKLLYLVQGFEGWFPGASLGNVVETYNSIPNRICVSSWLDEMLSKYVSPQQVIPNGIDTDFFVPGVRAFNKAELTVKPRLTLFTLLREDPQNGWKISSRVLKRIKSENLPVDIIGVGNKTDLFEIKELCDETYYSLDRKQMRAIYQRSDIFLDSSLVQGFGLMGLEAMSSGLACVLSASGGVREYADENNSILCELGDEEAMFESIKTLVENRGLFYKLKCAGYETAQKFHWDHVVSKYKSYLEGLISKPQDVTTEHYASSMSYLFKEIQALREKVDSSEIDLVQGTQKILPGLRLDSLEAVAKENSILKKVIEVCQ